MNAVRVRPSELAGLAAIVCLAAAVQFRLVTQQGLWADEAFSLAIATGHSLEHPAHVANPAFGDYVELPGPVPATVLRRYVEHESPPAGMGRVIRAVSLSDTSPPLYYLLLNAWTRVFGTTDLALRLFSVAWAVASLPVLCLVAYRMGGREAVLPAAVLLGAAPMGLTYAIEGRMYSMLWFLAVSLVALTIELQRLGSRIVLLLSWILLGTAGLLTHYFFVFAWVASVAWLLVRPGLFRRSWASAGAVITALCILPWYALVPTILGRWRITWDWLYWPLSAREAVLAPFEFAWNFVSGPRWFGPEIDDWAAGLLLGFIAITAWRHTRSSLFSEQRALIWLWLAATCVGPVFFDLINGTGTARVSRYAIAGLPAAILLVAFGASRLPPLPRLAVVLGLVLAWGESNVELFQAPSRQSEPFREIGASISSSIGASDVVLVHSIPSGVLAIARYVDPNAQVTSWVGQLAQRRVPEDIRTITEDRTKVVLVKIHEVKEPAPEEGWLREHALVVDDAWQQKGHIVTFAPHGRDRFAWTTSDQDLK